MKENLLIDKSIFFASRIIKLHQYKKGNHYIKADRSQRNKYRR